MTNTLALVQIGFDLCVIGYVAEFRDAEETPPDCIVLRVDLRSCLINKKNTCGFSNKNS